jgi:hypothetical protein
MPDTANFRPAFTLLTELVNYAAYLKGWPPERLMTRYGKWEYNWATFGVIWAIRQVMPELYSYPLLGRRLNYTDHTTALYGFRRAEMLRDKDIRYRLFTDRLLDFARSRIEAQRRAA